jgi:type VI protein secretion system component Hcp
MTIKSTQNQTPAAERTDELQLLTDGELCRVVGGNDRATKTHFSELQITKVVDASSPLLLS